MRHHRRRRFGPFGRGRQLRKRIWAHLLVVLLVGIFASGVVFFTGVRSAFLHSAARRLAHHAAHQIARDYADPPARQRTLRRLADELDVDVTLRAADGALLESVGPPFPALTADQVAQVRRGDFVIERGPREFVAVPLLVDGEVRAVLEASQTKEAMHVPSLWRPLSLLAMLMVIAGVASGPLARRISLPVERLTEAVRRFGAGDLKARVVFPPRRFRHHHPAGRFYADELEQLTFAFNEMAERIEHLLRGQKELLANVSHELRSPLARMRVALELLPRDAESEARLRDVEGDLAELDRLIEDVLTTSRLDASGLPVHLGSVDVRQLMEQIAARAAHDPATTGKTVTLGPGGQGVTVMADGALLKRALWNLVENAGKYGAPPIEIDARIDGGAWLEITVSDHGAGVPEEEHARLFEPFYRRDKARTPGGGFGLGLTLVKRVAEVHGGTIVARNMIRNGVQKGIGFTIRIPLT